MKLAIFDNHNRLKPIVERIRKEDYYVENNPRDINRTSLIITDKPLVKYSTIGKNMLDKFCIGDSVFNRTLLEPEYNKTLLVLNDMYVEEGEPNAYISCWFNGIDFVYPAVMSVDTNRLMEGDHGPVVDSMGTTLCTCNPNKRAFTDTFLKVKDTLRKVDYNGMFTMECIFTEDDVKVTRLLPYFQYDLIYAFFEGIQEEIGTALQEIAIGKKKEFKFPERYAIAVRLSIPPYPYTHIETKQTVLDGFCDANEKHLWLQNTIRDRHGLVVSNGKYGVICAVTARGCSVQECRRRAYRTIKNLCIEDMQLRRDVGIKAKETFDMLREWNWM
jgi:phosphoribosylamine--glycine ligase